MNYVNCVCTKELEDVVLTTIDRCIPVITWQFSEDEPRRPGQRLPTAMLGNEVMTKEQLYDLFQQILNVKKFEHQLLYNAMQVIFSVVWTYSYQQKYKSFFFSWILLMNKLPRLDENLMLGERKYLRWRGSVNNLDPLLDTYSSTYSSHYRIES